MNCLMCTIKSGEFADGCGRFSALEFFRTKSFQYRFGKIWPRAFRVYNAGPLGTLFTVVVDETSAAKLARFDVLV